MKKYLVLVIIFCTFFSSCRKCDVFEITGNITNTNDQPIYLEEMTLSSTLLVDSTYADKSGNFKFRASAPSEPSFFRLRIGENFINLGIDSTDHIQIYADAPTLGQNYEIEGSAVCKEIKELAMQQIRTEAYLKQLLKEYKAGTLSDSLYYEKAMTSLEQMKTFSRDYIIRQPQSLTAYYALFQKVNGGILFDPYDKDESKLFATVANVLNFYYPNNERTKKLYSLVLQGMVYSREKGNNDTIGSYSVQDVGLIEINLPTINGENVALSEYAKGGITLLDFTGYELEFSPLHTMLLGELYEKYGKKGLKIYQVSIDKDEHLWKNQASKFPWMCVRDANPIESKVLLKYNIQNLPSSFIIDANGNIIERVENDSSLPERLQSLLR